MMRDGRGMVIAVAMVMLAAWATGCAIDPMERLSEDIRSQDVEVRQRAVLQLANLDDDRTVDTLVDVLEGDDELCDMAGVALVKKGREVDEPDPKKPNPVVDAVGKVLNNAHLAESFRARAGWTLGEIGDRRAIPALLTGQGAKTGNNPATIVRDESGKALEKLGYNTNGRPFDLAIGSLQGKLDILPQAPPLATPNAS